jgi:hypothetical protein
VAFRPTQVHAQQHFGPVLRLGAARSGLEVDVGIVGIELAGKHAPEFEPCHALFGSLDIADNFAEQLLVILSTGELEELGVVRQCALERADCFDDIAERGALAPECLRALGRRPDRGVLELAIDLFEPFALDVEVKDTP